MENKKCSQCGGENFEDGFLMTYHYVVFMNDKLTSFQKYWAQKGKRVYAQECSNCGNLIMFTKKP